MGEWKGVHVAGIDESIVPFACAGPSPRHDARSASAARLLKMFACKSNRCVPCPRFAGQNHRPTCRRLYTGHGGHRHSSPVRNIHSG